MLLEVACIDPVLGAPLCSTVQLTNRRPVEPPNLGVGQSAPKLTQPARLCTETRFGQAAYPHDEAASLGGWEPRRSVCPSASSAATPVHTPSAGCLCRPPASEVCSAPACMRGSRAPPLNTSLPHLALRTHQPDGSIRAKPVRLPPADYGETGFCPATTRPRGSRCQPAPPFIGLCTASFYAILTAIAFAADIESTFANRRRAA